MKRVAAVLLIPLAALAEDSPYRFEAGSFEGRWAGSVETQSHEGDQTIHHFGLTLYGKDFHVYGLDPDTGDAELIGPCFGLRITETRFNCRYVAYDEAWSEIIYFDLLRMDESRAQLYVTRVVNNHLLDEEDPERHFFYFHSGEVRKVPERAATDA